MPCYLWQLRQAMDVQGPECVGQPGCHRLQHRDSVRAARVAVRLGRPAGPGAWRAAKVGQGLQPSATADEALAAQPQVLRMGLAHLHPHTRTRTP